MNSRKISLGLIAALLTTGVSGELFAKTRVSVTAFENKAGGDCYVGAYPSLGEGMADQLITKLSDIGKFEVLEREHINKMYGQEHELVNQNSRTAPRRNQFRVAHYTIAGAITSFEYCSSGLGAGVNVGRWIGFGDMKVGGKSAKAKVVIDLRVIDVATGEVLKSVRAEGKASRLKADVEGDVKGVDFGTDGFYNTPLGEATRKAISSAADTLEKAIPNRNDPEPTAQAQESPAVGKRQGASHTVDIATLTLYCISHESWCVAAKLLGKSEKGTRVEILNLQLRKRQWVNPSELTTVKPTASVTEVKDGQTVFVQSHAGSYEYFKCLTADRTTDELFLMCDRLGHEAHAFPATSVFTAKR